MLTKTRIPVNVKMANRIADQVGQPGAKIYDPTQVSVIGSSSRLAVLDYRSRLAEWLTLCGGDLSLNYDIYDLEVLYYIDFADPKRATEFVLRYG